MCHFSSGYGGQRNCGRRGRIPAPSHLRDPSVTLAVLEEPVSLFFCGFAGLDVALLALRQDVRKGGGLTKPQAIQDLGGRRWVPGGLSTGVKEDGVGLRKV